MKIKIMSPLAELSETLFNNTKNFLNVSICLMLIFVLVLTNSANLF